MAGLALLIAEWIAALWTWLLIVIAAAVYGVVAYRWGWRRCRLAMGRAEVSAAIERAVSETVPIPQQRPGTGR